MSAALWLWIAPGAHGELPPPELARVRPAVAATDLQERHARWRAADDPKQAAAELACRPAWPEHVQLCFRVWEGNLRRWVTTADLARWGVDLASLEAGAAQAAATFLERELEPVRIAGMSAGYWVARDGDGGVAAALLAPAVLAAKVGLPLRAALPSEGVLVAWQAGPDPDVDAVMAVGVREMYDQQPGPISPMVFAWDGSAWAAHSHAERATAPTR